MQYSSVFGALAAFAQTVRGGIDVYFGAKHDAVEFVGFLSSVAPIRPRESAKVCTIQQLPR